MKIAVITCYRDPDYIRARALRASLALIPGIEAITIKNRSTGVKRYLEVIGQIIKVRFKQRPDAYLLTFRGYEMLPFVRVLSAGKPLIYDELVNAVEWFVYEHKKLSGIPAKILGWGYRLWANSAHFILADTPSHADVSSAISRIDRRKYVVLPVGTDEQAFRYKPMLPPTPGQPFKVFFYGFMLPLHAPEKVIEAAEILKDNPNIQFMVAGRIGKYEDRIKQAQTTGAHLEYRQWIPFDKLPNLIDGAAINIAGPFGTTFQAGHVINGKAYQFLAAGRVALIGANDNTADFVNHANALVVPRGDAAAIAREIQWAYDNQTTLPAIAAAGRQLYDQKFSNAVLAATLQREITDLLV